MSDSVLILKAKKLIESVKGKTLSLDERKDKAIELAAFMLEEAQRIQTPQERRQQEQLAGMMSDPIGKIFTTIITDQCFRSKRSHRISSQLTYTINKYGIPSYLSFDKKIGLIAYKIFGTLLSPLLVPLTIKMIRQETASVILPGEVNQLQKHLIKRRKEGVRINLNHLGEAILGEEEALHRLQVYLEDLKNPLVEYISVKISTIFSQISLLAWNDSIEVLSSRLRELYRAAMANTYIRPDGSEVPKFVNLDMEEYKDLHLTLAVFTQVLNEPEFLNYSAGIVLQSYLPDSFLIQQELTHWANKRTSQGGAPIKIRIVKGANLAMEQVEAGIKLWPQAPYTNKAEVDANFKKMLLYGCKKEHAASVHLGIASHNLFDIAFALLLVSENEIAHKTTFEMLEGMADHMRRVVQILAGNMLLYCPAAKKEEFQNAVAYLVRRLDENTAPENFLRHAFDLVPGNKEWNKQAELFSQACFNSNTTSYLPRRTQNRSLEHYHLSEDHPFNNEPDTDWSLPHNRKWAQTIISTWKNKRIDPIPLVIGGNTLFSSDVASAEDPSNPEKLLYHYSLANEQHIDQALNCAKAEEKNWLAVSPKQRAQILAKVALLLKSNRAQLIGAMVADTAKTVQEADVEVSEAIDFAEYYRVNMLEWNSMQDIQFKPKGTVLITPPWNFPCSIPAGGILAALAAGNCVIFKPAAESVFVAYELARILWNAGISKKVLQFITCVDDPIGSRLIKDPRINSVVLTGSTETAKLFLRLRPDIDLYAETGGKNTFIITSMADRDLAIKDLIQSAFGHAGQKCSACSLAILEAEVYDDPNFMRQLKDATKSLPVGSAWDLKTKVNPLIRPPNETLKKGLTELESGEEWLVEPKEINANLWSPGIKLGVKPESFTFQNELFGPVFGIVRAKDFNDALTIMNQTRYGLTAGIHTLDEREQKTWLKHIEAGNCYINRTITGAIVERQPFGGCKESSFGKGAKAGGPNYLTQLMIAEQLHLPTQHGQPNQSIQTLTKSLVQQNILTDFKTWAASVGSYAFYWEHYFSQKHDVSKVLGQDNFQSYKPHTSMTFRAQKNDSLIDIFLVMAAGLTTDVKMEMSIEDDKLANLLIGLNPSKNISIVNEDEIRLIKRVQNGSIKRIRLLQRPSTILQEALAAAACHINLGQILANGRLELLHYLREVSISRDYHRYGNLGDRENERRAPLPKSTQKKEAYSGASICHA